MNKILYHKQDITTVNYGIIAHGCNCSGGFGSGVAGAIKRKWPVVYEMFKKDPTGAKMLGQVRYVFINGKNLIIANMYTQRFYGYGGGRYADPKAIENALQQVGHTAMLYDHNIWMPRIGCGLGGLDWETEVLPIVEKVANEFPDVYINIVDLP